ncbi:MAG: response regulator [Candidatus Niameybacter stercoravium]|nr:response regulator [Candidatus Niameybacter stercoravium]
MYLYKILIVDDEEEVRSSIMRKMQWEQLGYQLVGDAENGEDALEKVRVLEPDLVLTDIKMPYMDGLTLAKYIKEERNSTEIVIFSGFDDFEYAQKAIKLGVIEYILKPVNVAELTEILKKLKLKMDEHIAEKRNIQALRLDYQRMLPVLKEHFLGDLVQGRLNHIAILEGFNRFNLCVKDGPSWIVATTHIEIPMIEQDKQRLNLHYEVDLIPLSVEQIICEKLKGDFQFETFGTATGTCILCAIHTKLEMERFMNKLNQVCLDCKKILELNVTIGLGKVYTKQELIKDSYDEAKNAIGYRATIGSGMVIYISDVEVMHVGVLRFDEQSEGKLIHAIKFGEREEIIEVIESLMHKMKVAKVHTSQHQVYVMAIIHSMMEMAQKYELDTNQIWGKEDYFKVMGRLLTIQSMQNFIINSALSIHENINKERYDTMKQLIVEAKKYITEHFTNPDLSVEMVCEHLHISQAYFSTLFKKETGQTYISYLTELRLNKAIELLNKTEDKTYIIANKVGYTEPNYFSYVFKKNFGIAPSRYQRRAN